MSTVRDEIRSMLRLSLDFAEMYYRDGRVSQSAFDRWYRLWVWSASRYAGHAGAVQDTAFLSRGADFVNGRIARVRRALRSIGGVS